jgi:hypothetical protein
MQTTRPSNANTSILRRLLLAVVLSGCVTSTFAAGQLIELSSGAASFIKSPALLDARADASADTDLAPGTYGFRRSARTQNLADLSVTLNTQAADLLGSGKIRFAGVEGTGSAPFAMTIFDAAKAGSQEAGELAGPAATPEPETFALMLAGLGVLGFMAHRWRPQE